MSGVKIRQSEPGATFKELYSLVVGGLYDQKLYFCRIFVTTERFCKMITDIITDSPYSNRLLACIHW